MADRQLAVIEPRNRIAEIPKQGLETIDDERRSLWQQLFFEGATDADIEFCVAFCAHRDLDPLRGEVVFNKFQKKDRSGKVTGYTVTPVVTAIGYRVQASRSGDYMGQTPREWCGKDSVWKQVWLDDEPPAAARVGILRRGCPQPIYAVAVFKRFVKTWDGQPTGLWKTNPDVMIATRAETAAFKLAFPETRRNDATPSRIVYRDAIDGQRLRMIDGAVADDDGGEVFVNLLAAESVADRDQWSDVNRELHKLIAELHPEEPDVHALVHELVCSRFGVESTRDASHAQLSELRRELAASLSYDDEDVIDVTPAPPPDNESQEAAEIEVEQKVLDAWIKNIDRQKTPRALDGIVNILGDNGLRDHPQIKNAIEIKRGEIQTAEAKAGVTAP